MEYVEIDGWRGPRYMAYGDGPWVIVDGKTGEELVEYFRWSEVEAHLRRLEDS